MSEAGTVVELPCGCKAQGTDGTITGQPICQQHVDDPAKLGFAIGALPLATRQLLAATQSTDSSSGDDSSYGNDPKNNPIDAVRFRLRDTKAPFQFTNMEIQFMLDAAGGNPLKAALDGCIALQARFAGMSSEAVGSVSYSFANNATSYAGLAAQLRRQLAVLAVPYAGGLNRMEKRVQWMNATKTRPLFTREMLQGSLAQFGGRDRYYYDYDILCL